MGRDVEWRARLGLIVPSWNTVMEYETMRLVPPGVSVHVARIPHTADTEERLRHMVDLLPAAAELLAHARPSALCFGCTASGFIQEGAGADARLAATVTTQTGIPTVTTSRALVEALGHLGARRVAVASPYEAWLNDYLRRYLERSGLEVTAIAGFGTQDHARCSPEETLGLAREVITPGTQAVLISCTNFRTLELIERLERETGLPVVTSTQASVWRLLALAGVGDPIAGAGRLLTAPRT